MTTKKKHSEIAQKIVQIKIFTKSMDKWKKIIPRTATTYNCSEQAKNGNVWTWASLELNIKNKLSMIDEKFNKKINKWNEYLHDYELLSRK